MVVVLKCTFNCLLLGNREQVSSEIAGHFLESSAKFVPRNRGKGGGPSGLYL